MTANDRPPTTAWEQVRHLPITYRQFDYWVRTGYLKVDGGHGHGSYRAISESEMIVLTHASHLVAGGLAPDQAFRVGRALAESSAVELTPGYRIEAA